MRVIETASAPLYVVQTRSDACQLWEWLQPYSATGAYLGWDGETNAVDPWDPAFRLRTAQVSDGQVGWVIQAEREDFGTRMVDVVRECTRAHGSWVAHFAENDMRFAQRGAPGSVRLDSVDPHFYDTQPLLAWYDPRTVTSHKDGIDPGIPLARGLKPSVNRILGDDELTEAERALNDRFRELAPVGSRTAKACKQWGFANIDLDDEAYLRYAGLDAIKEIRLWHHMAAEMDRRGCWQAVWMDLKLQWHIDLMTFRGLLVDLPYAKWLDGELLQVVRDHLDLLTRHGIGASGMGPAVGRAFNALGVHSNKTTDSGAESWDGEFLSLLVEKAHYAQTPEQREALELARAINLVRKSTKFRAAYIAPMLESESRDSRVHCSMRAIGTVTSRQSAERPALQQLPKRKDARVRAAYVAPEGWLIVSADLKQGEPRVMAARSGDRNLQRDIEAGDINNSLASLTYGDEFIPAEGKDASKPSYQLRDRGKRGFLSVKYGAGVRKLASILGVTMDRASGIISNWDREYPQLAAFGEKCNNLKAVVLESGWIIPLWDRYKVTGDGGVRCTDKPSRKGLNADTQGNQAYLLRIAVHRLIDWGWSWALSMLVHDEIVGCVPAELAEQFKAALEAAMTMEFHGFPIRCDATIEGRSWMPQTEFEAREAAELMQEAG